MEKTIAAERTLERPNCGADNTDGMIHNLHRETVDPMAPYLPPYQGLFADTVVIGGSLRRYLAYVPEGTRSSTAGIFVLGENGQTVEDLWLQSGWKAIADMEELKEKCIVFFLEPQDGVWNVGEPYGAADGDVAYVNAVFAAGMGRSKFAVHEAKCYLVGCREGGVITNMAAMYNPAVWAGVVSVGGSCVSESYMQAAKADFCTNLDGFEDPTHRKNIKKGDIGMPAWIIHDPETGCGEGQAVVEYWKSCCGITEQGVQTDPDVLTFVRTSEPPYAPNQDKEAFRVCESTIPGASRDCANLLLRRIWKDFLYRQRRWMSSPGGELRVTQDPVRDLHMEYHYECVDGWMREWYVHVPEQVQQQPDKPVPLVFAMHGYSCGGDIYIGNSEWNKVADQYGFIVVFPTALPGMVDLDPEAPCAGTVPLPAWNFLHKAAHGPDELSFFRQMLEKVCADHAVDRSRIYATGHSHGSLMTQALALAMTDVFAAVAPCSGVLFTPEGVEILDLPEVKNRTDCTLPIWMFGGEQEKWLMQDLPENDNDTGHTIGIWRGINHIDPPMPDNWEDGWSVHDARWHDLIYRDDNGFPMVRYTWVDYMPHATMPEMSFRIWEEFFLHWSRKDGVLQYR